MNNFQVQVDEIQKEYREKGYVFRSEFIRINNKLFKELIKNAYQVCFMKILSAEYEEVIHIEHSQSKEIQYKFYKSVKNVASRWDKAGQSNEIMKSLDTLKERYMKNTRSEDIEHFDKYIELTCISETDEDLRIIFRVDPKNTDPQLSYDLSMRHYQEFFKTE